MVCPAWRWVELDVVAAYLIEVAGPAGVEGVVATAQQIDPSVRHRELFDLKRGNTCCRQRNQALTGHLQLRRSFFGRPGRQLTAARSVIPATTRGGRAVRPVSLASWAPLQLFVETFGLQRGIPQPLVGLQRGIAHPLSTFRRSARSRASSAYPTQWAIAQRVRQAEPFEHGGIRRGGDRSCRFH